MSSDGEQIAARASKPGLLVGRFGYSLDTKKRLTVPSIWRDVMGSPEYLYVVPGALGECLQLVPLAEMEKRLEKARQAAFSDEQVDKVLRAFCESTEQLMLDIQGRIRISDRFLDYAGLSEKVMMVGMLTRIQIWAPEKFALSETVRQCDLKSVHGTLQF